MRILCFGDSNTYGYDPRGILGGRYGADVRWVEVLSNKTGWEILNAGENGREIPEHTYLISYYDQMIDRSQPLDLLIVMLGSNDLLQGNSVSQVTARMEHFLESIHLDRSKILLLSPPPMKLGMWVPNEQLVEQSIQLGEAYRCLARSLQIAFADSGEWEVGLTFDGVHFSPLGHQSFADGLYSVLSDKMM